MNDQFIALRARMPGVAGLVRIKDQMALFSSKGVSNATAYILMKNGKIYSKKMQPSANGWYCEFKIGMGQIEAAAIMKEDIVYLIGAPAGEKLRIGYVTDQLVDYYDLNQRPEPTPPPRPRPPRPRPPRPRPPYPYPPNPIYPQPPNPSYPNPPYPNPNPNPPYPNPNPNPPYPNPNPRPPYPNPNPPPYPNPNPNPRPPYPNPRPPMPIVPYQNELAPKQTPTADVAPTASNDYNYASDYQTTDVFSHEDFEQEYYDDDGFYDDVTTLVDATQDEQIKDVDPQAQPQTQTQPQPQAQPQTQDQQSEQDAPQQNSFEGSSENDSPAQDIPNAQSRIAPSTEEELASLYEDYYESQELDYVEPAPMQQSIQNEQLTEFNQIKKPSNQNCIKPPQKGVSQDFCSCSQQNGSMLQRNNFYPNAFPNAFPNVNWCVYRLPSGTNYLYTKNSNSQYVAFAGGPASAPPAGMPLSARYAMARNGKSYWIFKV